MSSQKIGNNNALLHGGTSQKLILPHENQSDYEALLAGLRAEYSPETEQHHLFIEQLAAAHWFLRRRERAYHAIEAAIYTEAGHRPENLTADHFHRLALAERYKVAAERALKRAFANAESIRKLRKSDSDYRERHARWEAGQNLRERRFQLAEARHKAAESREAGRVAREHALQSFIRPDFARLFPNRSDTERPQEARKPASKSTGKRKQ